MTSRALLVAILVVAGGCTLEPVSLEGRTCRSYLDCLVGQGYYCQPIDAGDGSDAGAVGICVLFDASGPDGGSDAGRDAGHDAAMDAGIDSGSDAGTDAGSDAGTDAGAADAGLDAADDAGAADAGAADADLDAASSDAGTDAP